MKVVGERKEISSLDVHAMDPDMYHAFREYLEKRGVKWTETRGGEGELLGVHLDFPKGTTYRELDSSTPDYVRRQVILKDGLMYWSTRMDDQRNRIGVPYAWVRGHFND